MGADSTYSVTQDGRRRAAVLAAAWTGVIYATIPMVRTAQRWISDRGLEPWITPAVVASLALLVVLATVQLLRRKSRPTAVDLAWLGGVGVVSGGWAWHLRERPEEAIHLVEYGVLSWLIYRALRPAETNAAVLVSAVLLGTIMGTIDEIIQWITPLRFWDLRDVALNGGACGLGAVVAWRLEPGPWRLPDKGSVRAALRLAAALVLLITLTLANTPERAAWYSARVPGLGILAHPSNEMAEYGHLHRAPGVGEFKSRLTLAELELRDRRGSEEAAAIIDRYADEAYGAFQRAHQGFANPLVYEARVHIYSRDSNLRRAREWPAGSAERTMYATRAYRENQILERYFPHTLGRSSFTLDPETRRALEAAHDPDRAFSSRAGRHLITWISEPALRFGLLLLAASLLLLEQAVGREWLQRREAAR
jgi:hypothetical protein